ncbi:MAG: ribosome maturation factor RimP [Clostridiales bacterium]|nr:ribosome maturation factor RimP [Clostridiales bacterium]
MAKIKGNIASTVKALIKDTVETLGYVIWDVEYVKDGPYWYLRITIDQDEGIDIDDCEKVHRAIDPIIDAADPIEDFYYLEVSSPGVERELKEPWHRACFMGKRVNAKLFAAVDGQKNYTGELTASDDETITLLMNDKTQKTLRLKDVSKLSAYYDYESQEQ